VITTPTVLVLGAGASCPYGFPTAKQLRNHICEAFSSRDTPASRLLGDNAAPAEKFLEFREAFWKSGTSSVDAFLEGRPEFLDVGKFAIAYCLIPLESEANLYTPPGDAGDWYQHLSERLNPSFDEFEHNKLSIVTFNYDRSLEHYLFTSLLNWHGRSVDDCIEKFAKLPIVHVYGQLGKIPYPQPGCRQYLPFGEDEKKVHGAVVGASQGITLLHEKESELEEVHNLLTAAERVCFLGFSYHPLNLARLALKDSVVGRSRQVFGTARGFKTGELDQTQQSLRRAMLSADVTLDDDDNLMTLRRYLILG
jgi:hypothetical protein